MKYNFEVYDQDKELLVLFRNISLDFINQITKEQNIQTIMSTKFYLYGLYDKLQVLNNTFMVLKSTKKNIVLLNISNTNQNEFYIYKWCYIVNNTTYFLF